MDKKEAEKMNKGFHTWAWSKAAIDNYGQLLDKYPAVFKTKYTMPSFSFYLFSFECGTGWYKIIEKIAKVIDKELKKHPELKRDFMISQIKEKYGTLRFAAYGMNMEIYKAIEKGERKSAKVCEECGRRGKLRKHCDWYSTLCKKHYKVWRNK